MHQNEMGMKKRLKLFLKNNYFRLAHSFAIKRLKKIVKGFPPQILSKNERKKILFNPIYGICGRLFFWECAIAEALHIRGHDVKVLVCGKTFTMCTSEYTIQSVHDDLTCKHCVDFSEDFFKVTGIPHSTYKEYVSDEEIKNTRNKVNRLSVDECKNFVYKDVEVGTLSMNSVMRYFKGCLSPDKDLYESVLRSELINAIIATDAAEKVVKEDKPDAIVTRHMGYSSWGSFAKYCMNNGIRVCYIGERYRKDTVTFDIVSSDNSFEKYFNKIRKKKPLTQEEEMELQLFLDNRVKGKEGDTSLYGFSTDALEEDKSSFDSDKYDKTYAVFPNVAWDSSLLDAHKAFKDVYEWVTYTIELFKTRPDYQLIVKVHPSEVKELMSENTILDYINCKFTQLPKNIKIIPPDTEISPYSLFPFIDGAIVYNGTIGLEMILHDIPVVVAGIAHYSGKGFAYDVSTKKEYKDLLFSDSSLLTKQNMQLAKAYAYFYFIKSFVPYDFVTSNKYTMNFGWNIKSVDDFAEGKDKYLDHICDYITKGIIYQDW